MSVYEYVRDQETPVPTKDRPRGRRWRDFRPGEKMIFEERDKRYGARASAYSISAIIKPMIPAHSISEIRMITADLKYGFNYDGLDGELLKLCIENSRIEVARHFIKDCLCNPSTTIKVTEFKDDGEEVQNEIELMELARNLKDIDMIKLLEDEIERIKKEQEEAEKEQESEKNNNEENSHEKIENIDSTPEIKLEKEKSKEEEKEKEISEIKDKEKTESIKENSEITEEKNE